MLFIIKRIFISVILLFGISFVTFFLLNLSHGDYLEQLKLDPHISPQIIQQYKVLYKLDQSWLKQYVAWIQNLMHGDFGYSFHYRVKVSKIIWDRLFNTLYLAVMSFIITWLIAIPLGVWAAVKHRKIVDKVIQFCSYITLSIPSFFVLIVLLYFSLRTGILPLGGMRSPNYEDMNFFAQQWDIFVHALIPSISLSIGAIAALQRITKSNMLDVLGEKYTLMSHARGLPSRIILYKYTLRNAFNPMITLLGYEFGNLLSGVALIEIIYNWPGLGSLILTATRSKDIYVVMASVIMSGSMFLIGNLLSDIFLAKIDPRIKYESKLY